MILIIIWFIFILLMSLGASGRPILDPKIDTYHYILYGFVMLYFTYLFNKKK